MDMYLNHYSKINIRILETRTNISNKIIFYTTQVLNHVTYVIKRFRIENKRTSVKHKNTT